MKAIEGASIGIAWINYLKCILENGHAFHDEDEQIIELEDIVLTIQDDIANDPIIENYADKELKALYLKKMQTMEIVPELNASYGKRIFDQLGVNQFDWCVNRLKNKPESKAATMSLLLPDDPGPRIPCLDIVDFKLRDNILDTKTFFRSQNAMNAYGNLSAIFWLSGELANALDVTRGKITCFISNGHIYKNKIDNAQLIIKQCEGML